MPSSGFAPGLLRRRVAAVQLWPAAWNIPSKETPPISANTAMAATIAMAVLGLRSDMMFSFW